MARPLEPDRRNPPAASGRAGHKHGYPWHRPPALPGRERSEMRRPRPGERGAALLAVLLLVAVTGAIAAAAMEKLSLSRATATNIVALDQGRAYAHAVEQLAALTVDDMIAANPQR